MTGDFYIDELGPMAPHFDRTRKGARMGNEAFVGCFAFVKCADCVASAQIYRKAEKNLIG